MSIFWQNLIHLGITLFGVSMLLLLAHVQERATGRYLAHQLGWRSVLLTGWLGVPLHELSHLVMAKLFGHRIIAWKLFDPDPVSGTLGYVRHAYRRRNMWQILGTVFIALGPLIAGAAALAGLLVWMVPTAPRGELFEKASSLLALKDLRLLMGLKEMAIQLATEVWEHRTFLLPLQLYLGVCVTSHMCPSRSDLRGAFWGILTLSGMLIAIAGIAAWRQITFAGMEGILVLMVFLVVLAGVFQGSYALLVGLLCKLRRNKRTFQVVTRGSR